MEGLNEEQLKQIEEAKALLSENGLIIKTNSELDEMLTNKVAHEKANFEKDFASNFTSNFHSKFEENIKGLGFEKDGNEKGYDLATRIIKDLKGKVEGLESKSKSADEKDAIISKIQEEYKALSEEKEAILSNSEAKLNEYKKSVIINNGANGLKFKDSIPSTLIDNYVDKVKAQIAENSKLNEEGVLIIMDSEGKPMLNEAKNLAPYTATEFLTKELQEYIKQPKQAGTGSLTKEVVKTPVAGAVSEALQGANNVDEAFANYIVLAQKKGIYNGSSQFREDFNAIKAHYNVN